MTGAQFTKKPCFGNVDDVSKCYFDKDHCKFFDSFDGKLDMVDFSKYSGDPSSASYTLEAGKPYIKNSVLHMPLIQTKVKQSGATIMSTTRFLNYGTFEARIAAAGHSGVISAFISMSNVEDEIDFELVPKSPETATEVQANWYYRGEAKYDVNFGFTNVENNTFDNFHVYRMDWNKDNMTWYANGKMFKFVSREALGNESYRYPSTPARIQFGVWHAINNPTWAGDDNIDWPSVNAKGGINMRFDYIKIIGAECGGGYLTADVPEAKSKDPEPSVKETPKKDNDDVKVAGTSNKETSEQSARSNALALGYCSWQIILAYLLYLLFK